MTTKGEERFPFSVYVQPKPVSKGPIRQPASFSHFNALPVELQLHILTLCSASTLFQLMRVSSGIRVEASKLFWAYPGAYFVVEATWLLDGGYPSNTESNMAFLASVQNVQVDYWSEADNEICRLSDETVEIQYDRIADFWKAFTQRFPRAKRVVVNQCWMSPPWGKETHRVPMALRLLLQSSPPGITASAFIIEEADVSLCPNTTGLSAEQWRRAVYQWRLDGSWERVKLKQDWKTVLVPAKRFAGLVERWQEVMLKGSLLWLEKDGLWPSLIESLDRYHFDGGRNKPFHCPSATCDQYFQKAGEWTRHAVESHNQEWRGDNRFELLPPAIRGEFEQRGAVLAEKGEKIVQDARAIREEWKRGGQEQQRSIQRMWIDQVKNENAGVTEKEICKSGGAWEQFWSEMDATP